MGQLYFGDLLRKWVNIQPALTESVLNDPRVVGLYISSHSTFDAGLKLVLYR